MKKTPPEIRILSEDVANKIAAGEVVERPAAVAKELLENSIDAGATRIDIEFKNGGKSFVKVMDDGCGMTREQTLMSLEPHATSKISTPEDLFKISSYGFRGEAIPSIASVSKFCLRSRPAEQPAGTQVDIYAGEVKSVRECGMPEGTEIVVENLFCSVPARRKFLKSDNVEASHIVKLCRLYALALPHLAITLIENSRVVFRSERNLGVLERIGRIFGGEIGSKLIELGECRLGDMKICGAILKPGESFATSRNICAFINARPVDCRAVYSAIKESYAQYLPKGRFAAAFLFIELNPSAVDVNVHPAKREVRLKNEFEVRNFIMDSVSKKLSAYTLAANRPSFKLDESEPEPPIDAAAAAALRQRMHSIPAPAVFPPKRVSPEISAALDALCDKGIFPKKKAQPDKADAFAESSSQSSSSGDSDNPPGQIGRRAVENVELKELSSLAENVAGGKLVQNGSANISGWRYVGCVHKKYAVFETQKSMVLMSVTSALRRVHYQRAMDSLHSGGGTVSQRLLIPASIKFDRADAEFYEINKKAFKMCGFDIEEFGPNFYRVYAAPDWLPFWDLEAFVRDFIELARDESRILKKKVLADETFAKIISLKINMSGFVCTETSAISLLNELLKCPGHMAAPDGKPTLKEVCDFF